MKNYKKFGIIFDMDGTMTNNMLIHHIAWHKYLNKNGINITLEKVVEEIHGTNEEIINRLFKNKTKDILNLANNKEEEYRKVAKGKITLIDGFVNFIENCFINNIPLAIGTAAPLENVEFLLTEFNLKKYFKTIIHAGNVKNGKPNPEVFIKAAYNLNLKPSEVLVFEDSLVGAYAAKNANMKNVIVKSTLNENDFKEINNIQKFINNYNEISLLEINDFFI